MNSCDPADTAGHTKTGRAELARYCVVTGLMAAAAGAGASLVGGTAVVRLAVWALVLVLMAAGAGWWWARAPATAHRWTVGLLARPAGRVVPIQTPSRKS